MKPADYTYYYQYDCADGSGFIVKSKTTSACIDTMFETDSIIRLNKVWREGPKGGVRIIRNNSLEESVCGYITQDAEAMEEFMWAKLAAR